MWKKLFGNEREPNEIQHIPETIGHSMTEIPEIQAEIRLENGECCCLEVPAIWARRQKSRRTYKGGGLTVRVASGVYLRGGGGQSNPTESVENISDGRLFVTTKRLVFHGHSKSITLRLGEVADILHGPDHLQLIFEDKPTELFIIDQKLFNHEKVRQLISRVWLVARDGGFVGLDQKSSLDDMEVQERLERLRLELDELCDEVEERSSSIDSDLEKFSRIVTIIREIESTKEFGQTDERYKVHVPCRELIDRILQAKHAGETSSAETDSQLERVRKIEKTIFPILIEVHIFNEERMYQWPENSIFDGQTGLAGQAYEFAFDRQMSYDSSDDDELESFSEHWDLHAKTQKMGSTVVTMFHDCEALAIRSGIKPIYDEDVFAYITTIAAAEHICVERFGAKVWAEVDDSVGFAAGTEKLDLIHRFMSELSSEVGQDLEGAFFDMETTFIEEIDKRLPESSDPKLFYRDSIHAAEEFWVTLVSASHAEVASELATEESERIIEEKSSDSDIEQRLAKLKLLLDKGAISELEYQRQRQRILGEI